MDISESFTASLQRGMEQASAGQTVRRDEWLDEEKDMANIGTATVKVVPDLEEFRAVMDALPDAGFMVREEVTYEYDSEGALVRQVTTKQVTKSV